MAEKRVGVNFLEYIGVEEQNFLSSLVNFRDEFNCFGVLDNLYKKALDCRDIKHSEAVLVQLFLFCHYHFYSSTALFLRCHLSEALSSMRSAIDAALIAYHLIQYPGERKRYIERHKSIINIKQTIRDAKKKDSNAYSLADDLLIRHDFCSQFGSHADISVFAHRLDIEQKEDKSKYELRVGYFQFPKNSAEFRFYFLSNIMCFIEVLYIFREFFVNKTDVIDTSWDKALSGLGMRVNRSRTKCLEACKKENVEVQKIP